MIKKISLTNYKCYERATAEFGSKLNFITGRNGSGKTNLLDAVYYLSVTKSMLTPRDRDNVRFGADFFRLEGRYEINDVERVVTAKVKPGTVKELAVDSTPYDRLSDHIGFQPVIVLTPGDQILIDGGSAERRRFADFYLSQTDRGYLAALMRYNKLLASRNAHLKDRGYRSDRTLLKAYSEKMVPEVGLIMERRQTFTDILEPLLSQIVKEVSDDLDAVGLKYRPDLEDGDIEKASSGSIDNDIRLGRTSHGIHRDDFQFMLRDVALKKFGSQGQRKSFLVALHLAIHAYISTHLSNTPIILLDDIFDKLDDGRISAMLKVLVREDYGQVLITDARAERVESYRADFADNSCLLEVTNGQVARS